jgi:hypothetical protein
MEGALGTNVVQDWIQIIAGTVGFLGVLFLATGLVDQEKDGQTKDRDFTAPGIAAIGTAIPVAIATHYAATFAVPTVYANLRSSWPLETFASQGTTIGVITVVSAVAGFVAGYITGVWALHDKGILKARHEYGFWTWTVYSGVGWGIITAILATAAIFLFHLPTGPTIQTGLIAFLLFELGQTCMRLMLYISSLWLRIVGLVLSFLSILALLLPPIADLLGMSIM